MTTRTPYYRDNHDTIYCQDFRTNDLPDESVQMICTSPPYWGLRKYSGDQGLIWGPDSCEHQWQPDSTKHDNLRYRGETSIVGNERNRNIHPIDSWKDCQHEWNLDKISLLHENRNFHSGTQSEVLDSGYALAHTHKTSSLRAGFCSLCGAWKGAFGLEPTPELYIQHTIEILREIRRVLRKDGVVFWNIGDSYWGGTGHNAGETNPGKEYYTKDTNNFGVVDKSRHDSLKPKDLCLIPFRLAIAAQEDGWWVRSVIVWSKPNPMPESVTDRPTESHEYILMLTRSAKYYWDADAVRESVAPSTIGRKPVDFGGAKGRAYQPDESDPNFRSGSEQWGRPYDYREASANGRNIRSVWEFPTRPYAEAHFAVFPEKLPELCIKATTPEVGCCDKCGAPWERILEKTGQFQRRWSRNHAEDSPYNEQSSDQYIYEQKGWQATCECNAEKVPSVVLDPFMGAGTTLWVAKKLNRKAIGYEISEEYCKLAIDRCRQQVLL